ncbi:MAG: amino acid ABC transporter ATP-binding protein [Rhizobium sp.]
MNILANAASAEPLSASAKPDIRFENVEKHFRSHHVLKSINLDIQHGERVVVCGPSGSGKSTLIRCINRLEKHDGGRILVEGVEVSDDRRALAAVRAEVGMVFQSFNLFPHLTVLENCMLAPRRVRNVSSAEARDIAMAFLERVKIPEQAAKYPSQLSGGQQQRVAIARALCNKPRIMLFDEPTSALDPEMIKEVLDTLVEVAETGVTMVVVTHEMGFARKVANRLVFLDHGQVVESGRPDEVFSNPRSQRLREFLDKILIH